MKRAKSVEAYIDAGGKWIESLVLMQEIFLETELEESVKWGMPVYTLNNRNVAGFSAFKAWTGIWFFQGVFLSDPEKKLINAQEGTTKALRQWRFSSAEEIRANRKTILTYLEEAIQNQRDGKEVKPDRKKPLDIPAELEEVLSKNIALKDSFEALTLTNRRDFAEFIRNAKREETRLNRLKKIIPMILNGIGLNDKYKK